MYKDTQVTIMLVKIPACFEFRLLYISMDKIEFAWGGSNTCIKHI